MQSEEVAAASLGFGSSGPASILHWSDGEAISGAEPSALEVVRGVRNIHPRLEVQSPICWWCIQCHMYIPENLLPGMVTNCSVTPSAERWLLACTTCSPICTDVSQDPRDSGPECLS